MQAAFCKVKKPNPGIIIYYEKKHRDQEVLLQVSFQSVRHVGHQGDRTRALDGRRELTLVLCAGAGHAAGQNLAALAGEAAEPGHILVIDVLDLIHAKRAHLPARLAAAGAANALASILRHIAFLLFGL